MTLIALTLLYLTGSGMFLILPILIYIGLVFYIKPVIPIMGAVMYLWSIMLNMGFYSSVDYALLASVIDAVMTVTIFVLAMTKYYGKYRINKEFYVILW